MAKLKNKDIKKSLDLDSITKTLSKSAEKKEIAKVVEIELKHIRLNENQPREYYDDEAIDALAKSIEIEGLIQPIIVNQAGTRFIIIAGHRRYKAYEKLKKTTIPCIVQIQSRDHQDYTKLALIENLQREDLNSYEIAKGLHELKEEANLKQVELAKITGYSEGNVSKYLKVYGSVNKNKKRISKLKEIGIEQAYLFYCTPQKRNKKRQFTDIKLQYEDTPESIENVLKDIAKLRKKLKRLLQKLSG